MGLLRDIVKAIRLGAGREKLCPVCGARLKPVRTLVSGWLTPQSYYCESCGYVGPIFLDSSPNNLTGESSSRGALEEGPQATRDRPRED